ncbi:hypothetical protein QCA50_003672 [Cerrena zonata]|uniref:Uncharacterized protein n=1 Tax=Cerrena zonata TaxID=2478898 RepID=A0AAW0GWT3_9APHY
MKGDAEERADENRVGAIKKEHVLDCECFLPLPSLRPLSLSLFPARCVCSAGRVQISFGFVPAGPFYIYTTPSVQTSRQRLRFLTDPGSSLTRAPLLDHTLDPRKQHTA